jgi:hypothetical protein
MWGEREREVRKPYKAFSIGTTPWDERIYSNNQLWKVRGLNVNQSFWCMLIDWLIDIIVQGILFHHRGASVQCGWSWDIHTTTCTKKKTPLIISNPSWHSFKNFLSPIQETLLLSKLFLAPIHKRVYYAKLRRNWNASMCVEKQTMQHLQREICKIISMMTAIFCLVSSKFLLTVMIDREIF